MIRTILHTNDFHGKLTPQQSLKLKLARKSLGSRGLLIDAGDAGSAGNITFHSSGEPIMELMTDAGYDAMTVGNRDFHFSTIGFQAKLKSAGFPVLCANVRSIDPGTPNPTCASVNQDLDGLKVFVFGLTVPMITERMLVRKVSSYVFDNPLETAARLVPELRNGCDLLVCLSHIGIARDRELAERCPDIDLIVGGHTHVILETGETVGKTLIVQAGSFGKLLGRVVIEGTGTNLKMSASVENL